LKSESTIAAVLPEVPLILIILGQAFRGGSFIFVISFVPGRELIGLAFRRIGLRIFTAIWAAYVSSDGFPTRTSLASPPIVPGDEQSGSARPPDFYW